MSSDPALARPSHRVTILSSVHLALDNRVFYREARTLADAGYEVTLFAVHDRDEVRDGVTIRALPRVPRWQRPRLWRRLLALAAATETDVYHFHDPELLLVSPLLRWRTGRPTIYDIHEVYPEFIEVKEYIPSPLRRPIAQSMRIMEPALARHETGLIFADDQIAARFAHPDQPQATLPNYPDLDLLPVSPPDLVQARPPVVLYLGGLERNRGSDVMLAAFAQVLATLPSARLLLVGHFAPPELEQHVRKQAHRLGVDHALTITGRVPFRDVPRYLAEAAAGWVPWQAAEKNALNVPTKLFEYMAAGLPVVASDLPSIRPFISTGENGLLVEPADPAAHAAALLALLRDSDAARAMGQRGHELVQTTYNWQAVAPRLLALYDRVLALADSPVPGNRQSRGPGPDPYA